MAAADSSEGIASETGGKGIDRIRANRNKSAERQKKQENMLDSQKNAHSSRAQN
ncbi:hypothetical protein ABU178_17825 [Pantoea osteomyelitidis]|uniref:Uncharacterized protein n=1 Tax=Pantoea osteomyelitidis TaxID=3230026 RepID=A0ABW7Q0L1_9GAMM